MTKRWKFIVAAVATVTTTVPVVATLSPTAAFAAGNRVTICTSSNPDGEMVMWSWYYSSDGLSTASTWPGGYPEDQTCAGSKYYIAKIKYIDEGEVFYAASTVSYGDIATVNASGTWELLASCHGWKTTLNQGWNFQYMASDSNPGGGSGSHDCNDYGNW